MANQNDDPGAQARAEANFRRKEEQARDGKLAAAEYEAARIATREKTVRLRKLREAKEASDRAATAAPSKRAATKSVKQKTASAG